jgi:hypothetical protein
MGSLFSMPHIKSPKKPMIANAAIAMADFRKSIFGSIYLFGPHGHSFEEKANSPAKFFCHKIRKIIY